MDEELMRLHREARVGLGRHANLINQHVRISGIRESLRGILTHVLEVGGGVAILYLEKGKALEALDSVQGEVPIGNLEVYSTMVLNIGLAPKDWPAP